MVGNLDAVQLHETLHVAVAGAQSDELLHDWLAELLYIFEVRRLVLARFEVNVGPDGLTATLQGEPIDTARHQLDMEVKAITWHGLKVVRDGDGDDKEGWLAEVIVDI
jgi:SHS2 domain-containing protein